MDSAVQRLSVLFNHLSVPFLSTSGSLSSNEASAAEASDQDAKLQVDVGRLVAFLREGYDAECLQVRSELLKVLAEPLFRPRYNITMEEHRRITTERVRRLAKDNLLKTANLLSKYNQYVMEKEHLAYVDFSLQVKHAVHFGLFSGTVHRLGTEKHHRHFEQIDTLEMFGCFALTELGHGSNVKGIETTATHDPRDNTFVIHTPTVTAQKYWIGNAANDAGWATVFANLIVEGKNQGIHPFLVPIRNPSTMEALPGVHIGDCGYKMGLNGVDNGRLAFNHVRVPYDNLLNKFGDVVNGKYATTIPHAGARFNATLEALVGGRIVVGVCALSAVKLGLSIAIRYSLTRRQFGAPKDREILLLDWHSHQRRLMPALAATYAYQIYGNYIRRRFQYQTEKDNRELFLLAASFKAMATWHKAHSLQLARECCGGQGFSADNRIGVLRTDSDVDLTYEGDNTVLMQAVSKALLQEFSSWFKGKKPLTAMLKYTWSNGHIGRSFMRNKDWIVQLFSSDQNVRNPEAYLDAFVYREFKLIRRLARVLRDKVKVKKIPAFDAWNQSMEIVMHLARAYADRASLERFLVAIQQDSAGPHPAPAGASAAPSRSAAAGAGHSPNRRVLLAVCNLYCITRMEDDMAWFLEHKFLTPVRARAIHRESNKLCAQVRDVALELTDAFDIPEVLMDAPIAGDWSAPKMDVVPWLASGQS